MNKAVQQLFIVLVVISGTAIFAFESKNTSEDDNNIDIEYDYHRNLAEFQKSDKLSAGERQLCTEMKTQAFSLYDYAVVIAMLAVSLKIGLFYGFCHKGSLESSSDFMLGSQMSLFPVTLSLTTSFVTAIELLGNPAEMFFYGSQFALIVISMILVIPVALKVFYPIYHEMQLTSCYEYLGVRFGRRMRLMGGILYVLQMCFYTSVSVLAPAIALSKATGLNTRLAIILIYLVCVFYSSQGGLKAVVIADTFQAGVLFISMALIVIVGTSYQEGGVEEIFKIAKDNGRLDMFNFNPHPHQRHSVFSVIVGGFFYWTSLLCVNQSTVQKAMSLKSLTKAKIALTLSVFGLVSVFLVNFYTGIMAFAHYENCDPMKSGQIDAIDQLMPFYVMDMFGHIRFFVGIFVAGIFAASLGTVAACLSSLSAVTMEDLLIAGFNVKISPQKGSYYAKWMAVGYGIFSFGLIFLVEGRGVLQATLTLNGLVGGILLGLFSLGIFFKSANVKGAFYGGLLAICCVTVLGTMAQIRNTTEEPYLRSSVSECDCIVNSTSTSIRALIDEEISASSMSNDDGFFSIIYRVSYIYYSMIGTILTIVFGLIISFFTDSNDDDRISISIPKIIADDVHEGGFRTPGHFSVGSFLSIPTHRRLSSFMHNVSQSTLKVEHKIKEVISHSNLHHLHHLHVPSDDEERISILNEEDDQLENEISTKSSHMNTGIRKMFFIGHQDDREHDE
ncbi:sodium-coupled monocarboxylate transporter 1-like [Chironomus tepperi]|uniref:sodium-coupled monocarboxylate transporter 1-like n=1 Tax=Chironomus tepperi TaxID=113505 RepID=UPI00391FA7CF